MKDPDDPYRHPSVMGEVKEGTTDGTRDYIHRLAKRYLGRDEYQNPIRTERFIIRIRPDRVIT